MYQCEIHFLDRMKDEIWRLYYQECETKASIHRLICHHGPAWVSYKLLNKVIKKWQEDPVEKGKWANQKSTKKEAKCCQVEHRQCCGGVTVQEYLVFHPDRAASKHQQHSPLSTQNKDESGLMFPNPIWGPQAAPVQDEATTSQEMTRQSSPEGGYTLLLRQGLNIDYLNDGIEVRTFENTEQEGQK